MVSSFRGDGRVHPLPAAKSTFGYEYSAFRTQSSTLVHVLEFTEPNIALSALLSERAEQATVVFMFNCRQLQSVQTVVDAFVAPLVDSTLARLPATIGDSYAKYLTQLWSAELMPLAQGVLTRNPCVPVFFVGSFADSMDDKNDIEFDGRLKYLRTAALPFAAGIALSTSPSLFDVLATTAARRPLPADLAGRIAVRGDWFVPPGWDSPEKVDGVIGIPLDALNVAARKKNEAEARKTRGWQSFLEELHVQAKSASPVKGKKSAGTTKVADPRIPQLRKWEVRFIDEE
jgi:hypothetical protein